MADASIVRAAGGVIRRSRRDGSVEVALVHRPRYDDWTFPKGKLHAEESDEEGALREVEEETGLRCEIESLIGVVSYRTARGIPKRVVYFSMRPSSGGFRPNDEVDELRWLTLGEAADLLTHDHDRRLLAGTTGDPPL